MCKVDTLDGDVGLFMERKGDLEVLALHITAFWIIHFLHCIHAFILPSQA